ncbi:DUF2264 domain-containing protein [Actinocatenispora rupis]|uniref:DUF2264 domain-containing protein n=1 Tax=Actinocatenispora rupis TaxID=519421 RepID=A0A8J3N8X6_9ACTN|nr:DUF2264 domain-containing protein [Actinocatenispora rupis]GID10566.1 hypothetical protein Aru02nite_14550 [Actinocatenispora rupis]
MSTPPYLYLPPLDRARSTRTGWGRLHWEALADHLLDSVAPYATDDAAQYRMPGRNSRSGVVSDGLEGFARTFLLAAFRIAGANGEGVDDLIERYSRGLAAGAAGSWPSIVDRSQQMVEAAAIAIALHESRPWLFERLDVSTQDSVRSWLGGFVGKRTWDNNWILFQVVTEQFLASVDGPHDPAEIERGLDTIEPWYRGDGWYSDGAGANYDYYIGWAMHLYPLLWTRMVADDGGRGAVYRQRLREFLAQYQYFFGADGAPVHQGRSLTYRFASVAPLWLGALFDASPLSPGQTRRLASDVVRHFVERGVPDERGLLTLGWYDTHLPTTQEYSGPGSPYWASKGFLGLLLPPDAPVWTDPEASVPNDRDDTVMALPRPGFVLSSTVHDGVVRLLNHGSDHNLPAPAPARDDPHYAKLAYATHAAPDTAPAAWNRDVDGHIAVLSAAGTPSRRTRIERIAVADRYASSWHTATVDDSAYRIETASVARGPWEVRIHLVSGAPGRTVRDGGYAVAAATAPTVTTGTGWAAATTPDGLTAAMIGLSGWANAATHTEAEANAFGPRSATPYVRAVHPGGDAVYVSLVVLSADAVHPDALARGFAVSVADRTVAIRYPDGELVRLRLGDVPAGAARYHRVPIDGPPVAVLA